MMGTTMITIRFAIHSDPDRNRTAIGNARTRSKIAKGLAIPVTMIPVEVVEPLYPTQIPVEDRLQAEMVQQRGSGDLLLKSRLVSWLVLAHWLRLEHNFAQ
ncbi:hypothetical protein Tco_0638200 [Tanacetum coccineum]